MHHAARRLGTTLAITGAYVLAGELWHSGEVAGALAACERAMRPMVERAQAVPRLAPRLMHSRTRTGIRLLHAGLRLAIWPGLRWLPTRLSARPRVEPDLSRYEVG